MGNNTFMKKIVFYFLLWSLPVLSFSQVRPAAREIASEKGLHYVKSFIKDLADEDLALDIILSQHVIVQNPSAELYDYLEASLEEIRINLMAKNIDQITYKAYHELPRKEVSDIDPEELNTNNMYFLYYKDRLVTSIYVMDKKIGSFTLVSKGENLAHFVIY